VLRALTQFGVDLPGNLIMGEAAFARFHTLPGRASRVDSALDYPRLADQAMQGAHPSSSAGGEQPKFCTSTAGRPVLVKFSSAGNSAVDQRTRDLLVCDAEYVGEMDNWAATANRMVARKLLTTLDARTLRLLEAYGQFIANTDRHYGNISLLI
jgi:hypothetical protein